MDEDAAVSRHAWNLGERDAEKQLHDPSCKLTGQLFDAEPEIGEFAGWDVVDPVGVASVEKIFVEQDDMVGIERI